MPTKTKTANIEDVDTTVYGNEIDLSSYFGGENPWDGYDASRKSGGRTFEPIPEGRYDAEVVSMEGPVLNKKGTAHMLKVQYRVLSDDPNVNNHRVFQYLSLQPQSKFNLLNTFAALGKVPGDSSYVPGEFDGMPCKIQVEVRPASGDYAASNSVKFVRSASDEDDESSTSGGLW